MPRIRKADLFEGYVKTKEADLALMSELVSKAKGERSLVEFAEACKLNISTLSRIINNKNSGPSSDEVLARIALNAASDSGVTIDDLLAAAGKERAEGAPSANEKLMQLVLDVRDSSPTDIDYVLYGEDGEKSVNEANGEAEKGGQLKRWITYRSYISAASYRQAVLDALIALKYQVSLDDDLTAIRGVEFDCYADFKLITNALEAEGISKWAFIKLKETGNRANFTLVNYFGKMFLCNPVNDGTRITLVIEDEATYDILRNMYEGVEIPASFSLMLIDTKDRKVVSEYVFERSDGVTAIRLFGAGEPINPEELYGLPDED